MNSLKFIEEDGVMKIFKTLRTWLSAYANSQRQRIDRKTLYLGFGLIIFTLFSDTFLMVIGHFLHVLIEVIESIVEHFLEATFGLSPRQAELAVFYSGFFIGLGLFGHLLRKAYIWGDRVYSATKEQWLAQSKSSKFAMLVRTSLMLASLITTLLMFT